MAKILYQLSDGETLVYDNNTLCLGEKPIVCFGEYLPAYKRRLSKHRLANRLFRLEPRIATFVNDDVCILSFLQKLFFVSIASKKIIDCIAVRQKFSNVLNFCSLKTYGFEEVYWGDYGMNTAMESINIYKYVPEEGITVCYTFEAGSIKHIHNILYDKYRNRFIIFTGDFGDKVGIYIASRDFSQVTPFLVGDEQYRAVVGKVTESGLVWATDAVMHDNYVFYVSFDDKKICKLSALNGSVIYGVEAGGGLIFSTTVESYPSKKSKLLTLLDNRLAPGIKSKEVDVLFVSKDLSVRKIAQFRKDWLPIRLFQYGQVCFPFYENKEKTAILCNPMAVRKFDGRIFNIKLP